ncbi:MAG: class I SAM-dependent methyltransferase [bacterium]|nr:class I SAM-dependent methyltransferase [bacterium]
MDKKQQTVDTYNKSAALFADKFNSQSARVDDIKIAFSYIKKTNPKVLELGCGSGRDAKYITRFTTDYLGIDISEKMVSQAKLNTPEANFKVEDLETFEFPKNLDVVFSFASLLHSSKEKLKKVLERVEKSLNKNGVFFIDLKLGRYREETIEDGFGRRTFYYYTPEDILSLAPKSFQEVWRVYPTPGGTKWFSIILQKE